MPHTITRLKTSQLIVREQMSLRFVCELDGSPHSVDRIGGKAANLGRLRAFGLPVPAAWAVTTEAYRLHAQSIGVPMLASQVNGARQSAST